MGSGGEEGDKRFVGVCLRATESRSPISGMTRISIYSVCKRTITG